ncbi:MAG: ABC transporter permease [Anaerolinea sp.]|nr:ABC transporter permease [Anaerolinea sp.]
MTRAWVIFRTSLREQMRDPLTLLLTLAFAPLMVALYALAFGTTTTTYPVVLLDQAGDSGVAAAISAQAYANGTPILRLVEAADRAEAERLLRDRQAVALLIVAPDFLDALASGTGTGVTLVGDLTNPQYVVAAVFMTGAVESVAQTVTGTPPRVAYTEEALGVSGSRSDFDLYVPGILVFAIIMLVFIAAMTIARETERGTLRRLEVSRMTAVEYLLGVSGTILVIGVASIALTFLTALAFNYHAAGSLLLALLIAALATLGIVGSGLIVAAFSKTVAQAFIIANFPLGIFMFFSGAMFPIPGVDLFTVGGRVVHAFDFLPPTHAVVALNKVLTLGAGLGDVAYELVWLTVLSGLYFAVGVLLWRR